MSSLKLKSDFQNFRKDFEFLNIPKNFFCYNWCQCNWKYWLLRLIEKITQFYLKIKIHRIMFLALTIAHQDRQIQTLIRILILISKAFQKHWIFIINLVTIFISLWSISMKINIYFIYVYRG